MTRMPHGSRQQQGSVLKAMEARRRQHGWKSSYFPSRMFPAYLFRPNNILTGRYERKEKEKKGKRNKQKLETHKNKNNFGSPDSPCTGI